MVLAFVLLSEFTKAWLLYLGLIFLFMVMYAPGGVASLIMVNLRVVTYGYMRKLLSSYLALAVTASAMLLGAAAMIEMLYHLQLNIGAGPDLSFMGIMLNVKGVGSWLGAAVIMLVGAGLFEICRRRFARHWGDVQASIEADIRHKEAL